MYNTTVVSHSFYIVCVLYVTMFTKVLVSDVNPPYHMMLAISTEAVKPLAINPPTTMS